MLSEKVMKKISNIFVKTVLPLLLGVVILYFIYRNFDFSQVIPELKQMNMWWFAVTVVFGVMSHVIRGWRWCLALAPLGYHPGSANCVYSVYIAYALNLVVPRVGEVSRCVVLDRYDNVPFVQSLGTLVAERLLDTVMVLLILVAAVSLQWNVFYKFLSDNGVDGTLFSSAGRIVMFALSAIAILVLLFLLVRRLLRWQKVRGVITRFWEGVTSLKKMEHFKLYVFETVAIWFCYFMQFYLSFYCFDFTQNIGVSEALLLFVAGSVAVVVPTPNGAGPWHFAIISMLMIYGLSSEHAGIFALIVHSTQTLLVAILGLVGIALLQIKARRH